MFQSYLSKLFKKKPAEDALVPPLWGTREKTCLCFLQDCLFTLLLYAAELALFTLKIVNTLIKNRSRDDRPSIST